MSSPQYQLWIRDTNKISHTYFCLKIIRLTTMVIINYKIRTPKYTLWVRIPLPRPARGVILKYFPEYFSSRIRIHC